MADGTTYQIDIPVDASLGGHALQLVGRERYVVLIWRPRASRCATGQ